MTDFPGGGQRDFLAEAAQLAAQIDTWGDFEFQDEELPGTMQGVAVQPHWQYGAESMLAAQGAMVMRDQPTLQGTQAMCALYHPPISKADAQPMLKQPHLSQYFPPPVLGTSIQPAIPMSGVLQQVLPNSALSQAAALSIPMLSQSALSPSTLSPLALSPSALSPSTLSQPLQQQSTLALPIQPQPLLPVEQLPAARQSPRLSPAKVAQASNLSTRSGIAEEDDLEEANLASSSGSDEAWEPSQNGHISSRLRRSPDFKGRERSRGMQPRRRKQQQKGKQDDQRKWASLTQELRAVQAEKQSLEAHASMLEKALMRLSCEGAKQKPSEPVFIPALGWKSFDPKGSIVLSVVFDQPRKLTSEQVNRISVRDHCRLWREFVVRIRECLKHVKEGSDSDTPHSTKLKALLDERHGYLAFVAAKNPLAVHRLTQCKVTDPPMRETEPVPAQFYSNILSKMKLTEEQRTAFVETRNKYLVGLGYHSAALARAQHEVQSLDSTPHESLRNSSYLGWVQVSRAMQEAMDEIHVCHVTLMFAFYLGPHALSPFQAGTMLVESFPYLPDMIQLVKELAAEMGAPSSEELLHVGALKYQEKNGGSDIKYCAAQPYIPVVDKISDLYERASIK